ncbi:MAG: 4-(cytidine 5'-diphospho)-2-C-methyl-D-erythritol kinase [Candidatus Margulisiibacteriota bacterium]
MTSISLKAFAKINLTLKILGPRPDGFHEIESIMQSVSLYDEIEIRSKLDRDSIEIHCSDDKVPAGEGNICYKAVELIRKKFNIEKGIRIEIKKNIPMEAGLGGGSSNAAAVLIGLNKIWELKLSDEELIEIAAQIGSDVPFFIIGGRCLCKGRGENIEKDVRARGRVPQRYIVVKPDISVPTAWAYEEWDRVKTISNFQFPMSNLGNDLEAVVINKYPVIGEVKKALLEAGCTGAQMTGSGSAVFGVCRDEEQGKKLLIKIKERYPRSFFVQDAGKGIELV